MSAAAMHATLPAPTVRGSGIGHWFAEDMAPGHLFVRHADPGVLLAPLQSEGRLATGTGGVWAVVVSTPGGRDAEIGSVLRLDRHESVYRVLVVQKMLVSLN